MKMIIALVIGAVVGATAMWLVGKCQAVKPDQGVYVLCRFDLKDGVREQYLSEIHRVNPKVRAESGCLFYATCGDAETGMDKQQKFGDNVLWCIEKWASVDALKAHLSSPHMQEFGPKVRPLRRAGTFHVLTEQ